MPPVRSYTIKSYDGSTTLFSSTTIGNAIKILTTGITIADGVEWTYEGDKTFVGVSTVPNASRCEFGIGSSGFFPDDRIVYIYEQDSPVLPYLLSCVWDSAHSRYGTLKLNGVEKPMTTSVSNYYPIYENDILIWEEAAHSTSSSEYVVYYPAINGQIWRNNISLGGEDVVVTGDISISHVAEGFSYTVSATYFNNTVGEKNTVWVINDSIPVSAASLDVDVKFKSNNSEWKNIWWQVLTDNRFLYFMAVGSSSHTAVYGQTTGWVNEAYRTIEFEQPIWDNELSAWLQANATKQSTPTLTFKHFYDAGTIGTGTIKFRHYSQQEPSTERIINAGTYQFIEEPNIPIGMNIDINIIATINTLTANNVYGNQRTTTGIGVYRADTGEVGTVGIFNEEPYYAVTGFSPWQYTNENDDVFDAYQDTSKLRTIIIATEQNVSNEFYKWAITDGNLVKLS